MLSPRTIEIIKQTVPVLEQHGEALTRHFYARMFSGNPEVKAFFNPAHQNAGTQQQALAASICAYARNIEDPAALADAVELIAQKHASLGVKAEHYPIVGKHLLGSIQEVLGLPADHEVIDAWAEAYHLLADIFIQREAQIYEQHRFDHGSEGFQPFVVFRKQRESDVVTSFYLRPADGSEVGSYLPGQYLTVRVPLPDGGTTMRNYSLSVAPGTPFYRISVKREPAATDEAPVGYVSHYLHDQVKVGDRVEVGPPCGEFTFDVSQPSDRPLVLLSAGVGITPCLSMLHAAVEAQPGREIYFIHAALNSGTHAFRDEVAQLAAKHDNVNVHVRYSDAAQADLEAGRCDSEGFINDDLIRSLVGTPDAEFYYCGPKPFMVAVHQALLEWDVPTAQLHHEFFGPKQALEASAFSA